MTNVEDQNNKGEDQNDKGEDQNDRCGVEKDIDIKQINESPHLFAAQTLFIVD